MKIKFLLLLALFATSSIVFAAGTKSEESAVYVIKRGDTLWGLSERFIKDPGYWPNMWSKNSQITNPHFIYPGQKLRIFPDRMELVPKEQVASVAPQKASTTETLQEIAAEKTYTIYGTEGFLAGKDFEPFGLVIGTPHDRLETGLDDIVYTDIGAEHNSRSGDRFSILMKDVSVKHPISNEEMGNKIIPLGILQLTDVGDKSSRGIITKSYREINPGAYLIPYKDNHRREISLKSAVSNLKGYIVESYNGGRLIAAGDIIYTDLGTADGAETGNILYIVRDVTIDKLYAEGRLESLPQELVGAVVIIETDKKTSTALVVKSIDPIYKGDRIVSQTR